MIYLKELEGESYPEHECSVDQCSGEVSIIHAAGKLASCPVYLCEEHWLAYCKEDDDAQVDEEAQREVQREVLRMHRFKPGHAPKEPGAWTFQMTDDGLELVE